MRAKIATDKVEWDDRDVQATNYIYSAITNKQLEYISDFDSAYEIIQKFDEMYLKKSTALQIVCQHNLKSVKLKNYSEVSLFFDDFEKSVNELKQAGATISETEKLNYMLKALPVSYSYIGDLIDDLPEGERTVDYLKSKIKLKNTENVSETLNDTSNAFKADAKPLYNCFSCGKLGHLRRDCKSGNVNRDRGHSFSHYRGRSFSGYRGGGFSGYRGRGSYNNRGRGSGNYHHNNQESQGNSFHTTIANNTYTTSENDKTKKGQINWLLDSGCTDHIINIDEYFNSCEILNKPVKVKIRDGTILEATKIAIAIKEARLYKMKSYMYEEILEANMSKKEKLHRTMGHINFKNLELMCKNESLEGLPKDIEYEYLKCAICIEKKMHNLPFHNNRRKAEEILEIVHTDLNGPHQTTGYNKEKYFLSFIDDYSKLVKVYCIRSKDEVYDYLVQYVNEVQNLTGKTIKELRCDNGKEYMNRRVFQFAKEKGIIIKPCPAYVHQLNGTAERYNRTLMDMGRCLLSEAKEATTCNEAMKWKEAMNSEMDSLMKNNTWTLVNKPPKDKKVIDVKWVYKRKSENEYKASNADILDCFVDADWAGDIIDRKSTTGFVIRLFGNIIYWKSKKQSSVTKSSTFAEYVALSEAVTELNFLIYLINYVFTKVCKPVKIYEDNSVAVAISKYGNFTKNSKHIEVHYHFIHENVKQGSIKVVKIESEKNIADIFTKALGNVKFTKFREMLNLKE
ncbi:unnamed protein product [Parnassius mnemosyne]|uniref:Polyprotein n=1 Tax=Parnassius mnemosyne TaxID=213953 RepID=A0AAV1LPA7_9NEOP